MASVWIQLKCETAPTKIWGRLPLKEAIERFDSLLDIFLSSADGRRVRRVSGMDALLVDSNGRLYANLYVEPMSPPSKPEPGEMRRTATSGRA